MSGTHAAPKATPHEVAGRYGIDSLLRAEPDLAAAALYRLAGLITFHQNEGTAPDPDDPATLASLLDEGARPATLPDEAVVAELLERLIPSADTLLGSGSLVTAGAWAAVRQSLRDMTARSGSRRAATHSPGKGF